MKNKIVLIFLFFCSFAVQGQGDWQQPFNEGKRLYKSGDFEDAYGYFEKAKELAPSDVQIDSYLAQAAYRAGKFKEAAQHYQQSSERSNDTWTNYNQGNAQYRNEDLEGAINSYKEALRKDPNNEIARHNLAHAMKKQQKQQEKNENKQNQPQDPKEKPEEDSQQNENQNQGDQNPENESQEGQNQPKLGREQTEQLLESMNQADKRTQEKLKDKEQKAAGNGKREKDW